MKIPHDPAERDRFYQDLIDKCTVSQTQRNADYARLRHYFLFGRAPEGEDCPYNKIYSHIDLLTAFLFAAETTVFALELPPDAPAEQLARTDLMARAVNAEFHRSNGGAVFSQALLWSLVFNSMVLKLVVREKELHPFAVEPGCFGVLREDLPYTDRQEALVHTYYTTASQLALDLADHPRRKIIVDYLASGAGPRTEATPSGLYKLLLTASTPNMTGNVNSALDTRLDYRPRVDEPLIELQELWLWDDAENDYRVVTRGENAITIYDRKNIFLAGETPFVQVCPNPMHSYFWGLSEVDALTRLQDWRNERVLQIKKLLNQQVKPPTAMTGWMGLLEEKQYALFAEGGMLTTDSPQSKVERFAPELPHDLFTVIAEIDAMFAEQTGLQNIMQGKGEAGVRSGRQTSELARLGSARVKKRALVVEDALSKLGTLYLKAMQKYDDSIYHLEEGDPFTAEQFADDFAVKVDAHSSSPLFTEDHKADAAFLLENHVIDRESFLELTRPPGVENLKRKLKKIEQKEAHVAEQAQQQKAPQKAQHA